MREWRGGATTSITTVKLPISSASRFFLLFFHLNLFYSAHQVFFIDSSNDIITAFRDDSIFCWDAESLTCKFQLPSTVGPGEASPQYRDVVADGRHVVAAGRSNAVAIFSLESKTLLRVAKLPGNLVNSVKVRLHVSIFLIVFSFSTSSSS